MHAPRVAVIIPVYNGAEDVSAAIDSALQQRNCDVEVIVVNDGSTDQTAEVLKSWGSRISVLHQTNQGLPRTRNNGVRAATAGTEWIAFLDHDDQWLPDKLERQLQVAATTQADVVYTNARNFGDSQRVDELRSDPRQMLQGDLFVPLLMDNFLVTSAVLVRRAAFERVAGFTETPVMAEDWDLWLKLAAAGCQFAAVPEPLTLYRWRAGSFSKNHERMRKYRQLTVERALQTHRGRSLPWSLRRQALANVERCSAWFLAASSPRRAVRWYAQSLYYWPFEVDAWKGLIKGCLGRS